MRNNETGRSMVEMLGVLAIIGVLSVGGIAGYMMAMNRYHSNNVLEGVSARAVVISAQKMMGQPADHPADMEANIDDYPVTVGEADDVGQDYFEVVVSGIPQGVCRYVLNQKWTTPDGIYLNDDTEPTEDGTNCNEENNEIAFVFSPSMGGESNACGYCQHDEDGTCVADETCNNGCPGDKPMRDTAGNCYACSADNNVTVTTAECKKCSNRYWTSAGTCASCNAKDSAAADASECAKCPNRSMQDGKCVRERCPDGTFRNSSGYCRDCSQISWEAADESECAKCPNRMYYILFSGRCVLKKCPDGTFRDSNKYCRDCSDDYKIDASATECALCSNRSMQDGKCVRERCLDGQWESIAGECFDCSYRSYDNADVSECAKCSNRFRETRGFCYHCSTLYAWPADATECAKCSNREMYNGKCVLKECPSELTKRYDGSCV